MLLDNGQIEKVHIHSCEFEERTSLICGRRHQYSLKQQGWIGITWKVYQRAIPAWLIENFCLDPGDDRTFQYLNSCPLIIWAFCFVNTHCYFPFQDKNQLSDVIENPMLTRTGLECIANSLKSALSVYKSLTNV